MLTSPQNGARSIVDLLDSRARRMIYQAVAIRGLVRKLDAPVLHKMLNEVAQQLLGAQKEYSKAQQDAEKAVLMLENIIFNGIELPAAMHSFIKEYRDRNPRKAFSEWKL